MVRPLNDGDLQTHFPSQRPTQDDVFEIAIAAAGGTSMGAYIGGALDFLLEAFECWQTAADQGEAPRHNVQLKHLVGTSAGGLSVSLAAMMAVKSSQTYRSGGQASPLFEAWVDQISLDELLKPTPSGPTTSLFYPAPIEIRDRIYRSLGQFGPATHRRWLADPLEVRVTVGNLEGVPFGLNFKVAANLGTNLEVFYAHRDHLAFALDTQPCGGTPTGTGVAPDCYILPTTGTFTDGEWLRYGVAAVASSSIPLVFPTQRVAQDPLVYGWRASYYDVAMALPLKEQPAWPNPAPTTVNLTATDGGLFNNVPFDIAHDRLAGVQGRNPRDGTRVCRAVIVIDPLADDQDKRSEPSGTGLIKALVAMIFAPIEQSRLGALDLALIKDESIFSRFMIGPSRPHPINPARTWGASLALMTAPFHAILGFAARDYREHDFLLGRYNAQRFLDQHFLLPKDHWLVANNAAWDATDAVTQAGITYRPIIPLRGTAAAPQSLPVWTWEALKDTDIARYRTKLSPRLDGVFKTVKAEVLKPGLLQFLQGLLGGVAWNLFIRGSVAKAFADGLADGRASLDPNAAKRR
jgi:predicted acylesterase/phospholipase RssA